MTRRAATQTLAPIVIARHQAPVLCQLMVPLQLLSLSLQGAEDDKKTLSKLPFEKNWKVRLRGPVGLLQ